MMESSAAVEKTGRTEWETDASIRASGFTNQSGGRGRDEYNRALYNDKLIGVASSGVWFLTVEIAEPDSGAWWRLVEKLQQLICILRLHIPSTCCRK